MAGVALSRAAKCVLLLLCLAACDGEASTTIPPTGDSRLLSGEYIGVSWLAHDALILARIVPPQPGGTEIAVELVEADLDTAKLRPFAIRPNDDCSSESHYQPQRTHAGAITFLRTCYLGADGGDRDQTTVTEFDPESGQTLPLTQLAPLGIGRNVSYAVDLPRDRVLYTIGGGVCSGIAVATDAAPEDRLPYVVGTPPLTFRLDQPEDLHAPCPNEGRAAEPALSGDGRYLAFAASPESTTLADPDARLAAPWSLYITDLATGQTRLVASDRDRAGGVAWSPDSSKVSFLGRYRDGDAGIWTVDIDGGAPRQVAVGEFTSLAWSIDGRRFAAIRPLPTRPLGSFDADVVILDSTSAVTR